MNEQQILTEEIQKIKKRNEKVEREKARETSTSRKIIIALMTYFVMVLFFYFAGTTQVFINAIVPTLGFLLSTMSMPFFKNVWMQRKYKK